MRQPQHDADEVVDAVVPMRLALAHEGRHQVRDDGARLAAHQAHHRLRGRRPGRRGRPAHPNLARDRPAAQTAQTTPHHPTPHITHTDRHRHHTTLSWVGPGPRAVLGHTGFPREGAGALRHCGPHVTATGEERPTAACPERQSCSARWATAACSELLLSASSLQICGQGCRAIWGDQRLTHRHDLGGVGPARGGATDGFWEEFCSCSPNTSAQMTVGKGPNKGREMKNHSQQGVGSKQCSWPCLGVHRIEHLQSRGGGAPCAPNVS